MPPLPLLGTDNSLYSTHITHTYAVNPFIILLRTSYTGQVNAFGVFQAFYAENQLAQNTASEISWIGGVQIALLYISGLVLGRVFDKHGARVSASNMVSCFSFYARFVGE